MNFIGAIVLLGPDVRPVERAVSRLDPVRWAYLLGLNKIIDIARNEEIENRAYPYDETVPASRLRFWPLLKFLEHQLGQDIPRSAEIDIRGGWFKVDGEHLTFPEDRTIQGDRTIRKYEGEKCGLGNIWDLLDEARKRRIYIYGTSLLAIGFLLQFVDSFSL